MKSDRQSRAESLAQRFRDDARKPVVLEFAGVPKAGKTTTLAQVQTFLRRCGFNVRVVVERASVCPIRDKKHATFNVWTASTTLAQILEHTQDPPRPDDPQILILDRGLFDAICWLRMMDRLSRIRTEDRQAVEAFLLRDEWRQRLTGVIVMTVAPEDSLKREQGLLPIVGASGSIMNPEVLNQMLVTTKNCIQEFGERFPLFHVDTSMAPNNTPVGAAETVVDHVLTLIEEQLSENILAAPKGSIAGVFRGRLSVDREGANELLRVFRAQGTFGPRKTLESNTELIQALPVVIVRNRSGQVLRMRRREKQSTNPLHEKLVIWAGGHVRSEDGTNGEAILRGALRELNEELRLSVESDELQLLGAVYVDKGPVSSTSKHVALVFEWRAETDDIAVTLSTAEFFERRGTSLSGKFISIEDLAKEVEAENRDEPWSLEILERLLAPITNPNKLF